MRSIVQSILFLSAVCLEQDAPAVSQAWFCPCGDVPSGECWRSAEVKVMDEDLTSIVRSDVNSIGEKLVKDVKCDDDDLRLEVDANDFALMPSGVLYVIQNRLQVCYSG